VVRGSGAPELLAAPSRQAIRTLDANLPVSNVAPLRQLVERSQARMTLSVAMFCVATIVALALAIVGVYGFVSYFVSQRLAEIGMRMAIGARRSDIRWMVLRSTLVLAAAGVLVGLAGAAVLTRLLRAWLFKISPFDPLTFVAVPLLLALVVGLASFLPAERAAQVEPVALLRR
jgi:ABC-type antimicrobial peptide transport system permease subunit